MLPALKILYDNWPIFTTIIVILVLILGWLVWRAHQRKITTGNEGIVGETGMYKGNGLVQVHGELWKCSNCDELQLEDIVEVTAIDKLVVSVVKRS